VSLAWCFSDEATPFTVGLLNRASAGEEVTVPSHWPIEVLNGIVMGKVRGRISDADKQRFLQDLSSLRILIDDVPALSCFDAVYELAGRHKLTAYDAAYLELAIRRGLPLAMLDKALLRAAIDEAVTVA
jgi:predicted nucleic acid-binding protein